VIASSEQSALETLVQAGGPLEYVGTRLTLPQIDPGDWSELKRRFKELGAPIDPHALHLLLEESMAHPYCTMFLASRERRRWRVRRARHDRLRSSGAVRRPSRRELGASP